MSKPSSQISLKKSQIQPYLKGHSHYLSNQRYLWALSAIGCTFISLLCLFSFFRTLFAYLLDNDNHLNNQHYLGMLLVLLIFIVSLSPVVILLQRFNYCKVMQGRVIMLEKFFFLIEQRLDSKNIAIDGELSSEFPGEETIYKCNLSESLNAIFKKDEGLSDVNWANLTLHFSNGYQLNVELYDKVRIKSLFEYFMILLLIKLALMGALTFLKFLIIKAKMSFSLGFSFGKLPIIGGTPVFSREMYLEDHKSGQSYSLYYDGETSFNEDYFEDEELTDPFLYEAAQTLGIMMSDTILTDYQYNLHSTKSSSPPKLKRKHSVYDPNFPRTEEKQPRQFLTRITRAHKTMLESSPLDITIQSLEKNVITFDYEFTTYELDFVRHKHSYYSTISCHMNHLDSVNAQILLSANKNLLYGRFARAENQTFFMKSFLYECFKVEELTRTLEGMAKVIKISHQTMSFPSHTGPLRISRQVTNEERVLHRALSNTETTFKATPDGYTTQSMLPSGRSQTVSLNFSQQDIFGQPIITCLSYCGEADISFYEEALKLNARPGYGAFALKPDPKGEQLVMTETQLYQKVDPFELKGIILHLATRADRFEEKLSETDRY